MAGAGSCLPLCFPQRTAPSFILSFFNGHCWLALFPFAPGAVMRTVPRIITFIPGKYSTIELQPWPLVVHF